MKKSHFRLARLGAVAAFMIGFVASGAAAGLVVKGRLVSPAKVGENQFELQVADETGKLVVDAAVTITVEMSDMDMGTSHPKVENRGEGVYASNVSFSMSGGWRVTATIEAPGQETVTKTFAFEANVAQGMAMGSMMGKLGSWGMQREASGTSWLPDSSPMFMKMLPKSGRYELTGMGFFTLDEGFSGGKRGDDRFYSNSMLMLMARRETGGGIVGLNFMASADPIFNGEFGYPDLFQTGETAHGQKLVDYQHPHDLISEVTASYSHPMGGGMRAFLYGGPVGEPALGGPTFMHRPSGMEIPEAPISHHWFDSTHVAWGVATLGLNSDKWQVEGSVFNGHEPDENRYSPDPLALNSASARITYNPNRDLSLNASYGFLHSPESTDPGVDQHRLTAAGIWSRPMPHRANLSTTAAFGRNIVQGKNSDAFLTEATYLAGPTSIFARWEHVDKDELVGVPPGDYMINKFLFGGVRNIAQRSGFDLGIGAYAGLYIFPSSLEPFYGRSPLTLGVFLRLRPARM